jgi:hypothetical protein
MISIAIVDVVVATYITTIWIIISRTSGSRVPLRTRMR